jgi:hypothetical protein
MTAFHKTFTGSTGKVPRGRQDTHKLGPAVEWQIVGISRTVRYDSFRDENSAVDVPFAQSLGADATIGIRTAQDPAAMITTAAAAIHKVDPQVALADTATMDRVKSDALVDDRFTMQLYAGFALAALLLAAVGIYGLMAFTVSQRTQEIGIRMALGASRGNVARLIIRQAAPCNPPSTESKPWTSPSSPPSPSSSSRPHSSPPGFPPVAPPPSNPCRPSGWSD